MMADWRRIVLSLWSLVHSADCSKKWLMIMSLGQLKGCNKSVLISCRMLKTSVSYRLQAKGTCFEIWINTVDTVHTLNPILSLMRRNSFVLKGYMPVLPERQQFSTCQICTFFLTYIWLRIHDNARLPAFGKVFTYCWRTHNRRFHWDFVK